MYPGRNMYARKGSCSKAFSVRPLTCPHGAPALGAVGTRTGHVDEGHVRVLLRHARRRGHREVVRDAPVLVLAHPGRGDTEAEEAGVVAGELVLHSGEIEEVPVAELGQLSVALPGGGTAHHEHGFDRWIEQALTQDALAHHAGGAEQDDLHVSLPLRAVSDAPQRYAIDRLDPRLTL